MKILQLLCKFHRLRNTNVEHKLHAGIIIYSADETKPQMQEYDFVEQLPFHFNCPVTYNLLLKPHQTDCCGHHLSEETVNKIQGKRQPCPLCKKLSWTTHFDTYFYRQVHEIHVFCHHKKRGCEWEGELRDLKSHVESCTRKDSPISSFPGN